MASLFNIISILMISLNLYSVYPQKMCIECKSDVIKKITVVEKSITNNFGYLKEDIKMPQMQNGRDQKKIENINYIINKNITDKVEDALKLSKEYFEGKTYPKFPYEIYSRYAITEDNYNLISLYNDYYEYLGGAHGITTRTSYTIDKNNENLLTLKDLFKKDYNYIQLINEEIKKEISKNPENYFYPESEFKGISENQDFYIQASNLVIYYQLYEIAPYVFGIPEFKIPLELFGENYIYS